MVAPDGHVGFAAFAAWMYPWHAWFVLAQAAESAQT